MRKPISILHLLQSVDFMGRSAWDLAEYYVGSRAHLLSSLHKMQSKIETMLSVASSSLRPSLPEIPQMLAEKNERGRA